MNKKLVLLVFFLCNAFLNIFAQKNAASIFSDSLVKPRMRLIIVNDFGGDHDGFLLVAAAHDLKQEVGGMRVVGQVADLASRLGRR